MPRARRSMSPVRRPVAERLPPPVQSRQSSTVQSRQAAPMSSQPAAVPTSQGPGLMAQMASTAGGVAIGSVVGHGISNALFGGGNSGSETVAAPPPPQPQYQSPQQQVQASQVCGFELEQFLRCTQSQQDISLCEGFNDALKQCKQRNGLVA